MIINGLRNHTGLYASVFSELVYLQLQKMHLQAHDKYTNLVVQIKSNFQNGR